MTDWQRLEQIIRWTGLSTNAFAFSIGLKRSQNLYQIKRHRNRISKDLADRIVRRYPVFDRSWLLTGDGPSPDLSSLPLPPRPDPASGRIPFYPLDVLRLASDPSLLATAQPDGHLSIPGIDDCDLAALCTGDHMAPDIPSGAIVALRRVDPQGPVLPGEIYLLVTSEYARMGYIRPDRKVAAGLWLDPPSGSDQPPLGLRRDRIRHLYLVQGIVIRKVL